LSANHTHCVLCTLNYVTLALISSERQPFGKETMLQLRLVAEYRVMWWCYYLFIQITPHKNIGRVSDLWFTDIACPGWAPLHRP